MFLHRIAAAAALAFSLAAPAAAQTDLPPITVGTLENGTVSWELETIRSCGLDTANGFALRLLPLVAMQGGEVDTIVSDFLWVAQQRAAGADFVFSRPIPPRSAGSWWPPTAPCRRWPTSTASASASPAARWTRAG